MTRKTEKRRTLWECTAWACPKVMSEGTGKKRKIIVSDGVNEVQFTPKEFTLFKEAIKKGEL